MAPRPRAAARVIAGLLLAVAAAVPASVFEPWFSERGVAVSRTKAPGETPWIRGVAPLPAAAEAVYAVVIDYGRYRQLFDPAVSKADVLDAESASARLHLVWPYPFPFRRRDAIVEYRGERLPGGLLTVRWRDAARPGDPSEGVRIERVAGETQIEPVGEGRCLVTYTYLGDLGGSFPRAAEEKAWRHEPLGYFQALRRRLGLPIPPQ